MKIYRRYILNKVIVGFLGFATIWVSLIWFSRAIGFVRYITENGIELSKFFYLFVLILPWLLLFIIPVSLFAAILIIYNRLISTNEITILKNSGLTNYQISKPITSFVILISLICYLIAFFLMPFANRQLRIIRSDLKNNYANLAFNPKTFETFKNLTIYAKEKNEDNKLFGILLHDEKSNQYSMTITAKNGIITSNGNASLLYMEDGTVQKYNRAEGKTEILNFDSYVFNLTEGNTDSKKWSWKQKERYLNELLFPDDEVSEADVAGFRSEINQRFTYPLLPIVFAMIAVAFILRGSFRRGGNFSNIVAAILVATTFLTLTIMSYRLIEMSANYVIALYLNFIIFFAGSLKLMITHNRKKR
jgi:lipopolysaccharide export system permease protein